MSFSRLCAKLEEMTREPFKNTKLYLRFFTYISGLYLFLFFLTKNWYNGWYGILCSFLNVDMFISPGGGVMYWVWGILELILQIGCIVGMVFAFIQLFRHSRAKIYRRRYNIQTAHYMEKQHVICLTGPPGSGKTSAGGDMAVHVAAKRWAQLLYDYHTKKRQIRNYVKFGQTEELEKFRALEESYEFFKRRERKFVPCLATSFGMRVGGRYTYKASNAFFNQTQRIPEYCVIFDDEAGGSKGADTSSRVSNDVADFYRYVRHCGDYCIIMTEQGDDGNGKYIRKCTDDTIYCKKQEWIERPNFLLHRWEKQKWKLIRREEEGKYNVRKNVATYYLGRILQTIGYRRIEYKSMGNVEHDDGDGKPRKGGYFLLPSRLIYEYDDRAYRFTYKAKDLPLNIAGWERLTLLPQDDVRRISITREAKNHR